MTDKSKPTVALVGATGRVGGWVLEELLQREYSITVLARSPAKLDPYKDKITIVQGDSTQASAWEDLLKEKDIDIVISTLGSPNKETLIVEASAKAMVEALEKTSGAKIPRIIWMTSTGINEAIPQAKMYTLFGNASSWIYGGYGMFGLLVFKVLIPLVIGQALWDDMGLSELVIREKKDICKQTVLVRPTNMHPVSEHPVFSEEWRKEGGSNTEYDFVSAETPPPGKWMNRRAIACALCDLIQDDSRDGTAVSLFQKGEP